MSDFTQFFDGAVKTITEVTNNANAVADRIINADNQNKLIHEVRETSDDETIAKFRAWSDQANAAIEKKQAEIDAYIVSQGLVDSTPVDVPTETENYKTLAQQIKGLVNALKPLPGGEDAIKNVPELKNIPGTRKAGSNTSGGGTGTRRPRISKISVDYGDGNAVDIYETVKGENGQPDKTVANLTTLSKALTKKFNVKVDVKSLQSELFAAAKTEDLSTLEGAPVTFPVTLKTSDDDSAPSTIVTVTATPTVK